MTGIVSGLEARLGTGDFVITAETSPPLGTDVNAVLDRVAPLKGLVDAVNVTDGAGARAHLSAHVAAQQLLLGGFEPVLQFTTRDRNKLALERDLLGATAIGAHNILCLSGDPITRGDEPEASEVNDLDSAGLVALAHLMREERRLPSGREIAGAPHYFIGVADTPVEPGDDFHPGSLLHKLEWGAQFIQTQFCFDAALFARYAAALAEHGITRQAHLMAGIGPLASAKQAVWVRDNLWGSTVPDDVIERLDRATDPKAEGIAICRELLDAYREMPGVAGVHLMGPGVERRAAEIIAAWRGAG